VVAVFPRMDPHPPTRGAARMTRTFVGSGSG
jgi:hypothetical protein